MQVNGQQAYTIDRQLLWSYLMDPEVLAKITPGVSNLEVVEEGSYQSISEVKIGPVKGVFKGKLKIADVDEPNSFTIDMEQLSKIGNAHAKVQLVLESENTEEIILKFDAKAKLSGLVARTGQRVLSGVANKITKEFFSALEEYIEENKPKADVA